jgi:predicted enzyme related to lactoylglutathione lyase
VISLPSNISEHDVTSTQVASKVEDTFDMKFEFIVLPVADVERAKAFYAGLGWKLDMEFVRGDDFRVIQFTPPGSPAPVIFGRGITSAKPGSAQGLYLVVSDIEEAARAARLARGAVVSELSHDGGGVFHDAGTEGRLSGPAPEPRSYSTFAERVRRVHRAGAGRQAVAGMITPAGQSCSAKTCACDFPYG